MRKGLIPLFIAYVIRQYLSNVVLYFKNKEVELSASILNSLNEDPENYYLLIETGTQEKEEYLDKLENLFLQQPDMNVSSVNKCYSVVKLMQNWVRGLPEYTKKFRCYYEGGEKKQVDDSIVIIRSELLKFEVNARDLLYHVFLNGVGCSDFQQSYNLIRKTKEFLDNHLNNSCKELQLKLKSYFIPGYQGSLSNAVISWYQALPEYTKTKVFDSNANFLLSIAKNITSYDNDDLLDKFIFTFTSIGIADWNDAANDLFLSEICDAIARVNSYTESDSNSQKNKLTIQIASGIYEKSFSTDSISPLGQTTLNNLRSVFEEYNDALEPDEKLAILSQLIEDIIQSKNLPYVLFSDGHGMIADWREDMPNVVFSIKKSEFYRHLKSFLDHYRETEEIDLRIIAYGKDFLKQLMSLWCQAVFSKLAATPDGEVINTSKIDNRSLRLIIENAQPKVGVSFNDVMCDIEDGNITAGNLRNNINNILSSVKKYGKNISSWK